MILKEKILIFLLISTISANSQLASSEFNNYGDNFLPTLKVLEHLSINKALKKIKLYL
jgi:hypothetical protein